MQLFQIPTVVNIKLKGVWLIKQFTLLGRCEHSGGIADFILRVDKGLEAIFCCYTLVSFHETTECDFPGKTVLRDTTSHK
jgi:hypothetical protein